MSFAEVLNVLPSLSLSERQMLIRRAFELDESGLPSEDLALVEKRLEEHHLNPMTSVSLDDMKARVRSHLS
jgi:hypothetical protein